MGSAKEMALDMIRTLSKPIARRAIYFSLAVICMACGSNRFASAADQKAGATYSVIICGLGGEPEYEKIIQGWGKDLYTTLKKNTVPEDHLFWLAANKEPGVYSESRRDQILKLFDSLAERVTPEDSFQLFLIGHGSFDEYDYRFNIPGPDIRAAELADLMGRIRAERQLVVNMTSSSGASLAPLRKKGRIVITATSAGMERNFSEFPRYFIAALQDPAADADKNQEISALEAYRYATREVARYYQQATRIATEHAMMEDRGEGEGVRDPGAENGEGLMASAMVLVRLGSAESPADTPELRGLRAEKRSVEEQIEALKYKKASMKAEEYSAELEKLLLQLSKVQQQLDDLEKK